MIPILHNTLLATPKLKFYFGAFANFWSSPNPATTIFMGPNSNFILGNLFFWGVSQTQILLRGLLPILGAHWCHLGFRGPKSNFTLGAFVLLGRLRNSNFTPGLWPIFGAHQTQQPPFCGPKFKFYSGAFVLLGRLPNSNFTPRVFAHFWGPSNPTTTILMDPNSNFNLGAFVFLGKLPN
jgi:hypothetical protein